MHLRVNYVLSYTQDKLFVYGNTITFINNIIQMILTALYNFHNKSLTNVI